MKLWLFRARGDRGADSKFEFEFKRNRQVSIERNTPIMRRLGAERCTERASCRLRSVASKGTVGWDEHNRGATNAVLCERRALYILDDSKRFAMPKTTVSNEPNPAEGETAGERLSLSKSRGETEAHKVYIQRTRLR